MSVCLCACFRVQTENRRVGKFLILNTFLSFMPPIYFMRIQVVMLKQCTHRIRDDDIFIFLCRQRCTGYRYMYLFIFLLYYITPSISLLLRNYTYTYIISHLTLFHHIHWMGRRIHPAHTDLSKHVIYAFVFFPVWTPHKFSCIILFGTYTHSICICMYNPNHPKNSTASYELAQSIFACCVL